MVGGIYSARMMNDSIKVIVSSDIYNMGMLYRDDVGVRILLQFDAQFSAFRVESKNAASFFALDGEMILMVAPSRGPPVRLLSLNITIFPSRLSMDNGARTIQASNLHIGW